MKLALVSAIIMCVAAAPTTEDGWNEEASAPAPKLELIDTERIAEGEAYKASVVVQLTATKTAVDVSNNKGLGLVFTVFNPGKTSQKLMKQQTPFEGAILSNMFVVRDEWGNKMKYTGADAKRAPVQFLQEQDYIELKAGESQSVSLDIAGSYEFTHDGTYYIRVAKAEDGYVTYQNMMGTMVTVHVSGTKAKKALIQVAEQKKRQEVQLLQGKAKAGDTYKANCTPANKNSLLDYKRKAKAWLDKAVRCTKSGGGGTCKDNVKAWFNPSSQSQFEYTVTKGLQNMINVWDRTNWDCNPSQCRPNVFGYVYPTDTTQTVHMCPFTFSYSVESEKMQTVVHELTHFDHIGVYDKDGRTIGDRDFGYGEGLCQKMATDTPVQAMNNADNIGYFTRDVGLDVNPNCKDESGQCA